MRQFLTRGSGAAKRCEQKDHGRQKPLVTILQNDLIPIIKVEHRNITERGVPIQRVELPDGFLDVILFEQARRDPTENDFSRGGSHPKVAGYSSLPSVINHIDIFGTVGQMHAQEVVPAGISDYFAD
jgi:hypothetical protein